MLVALGESYEKLSQQVEAKKVRMSHPSLRPALRNKSSSNLLAFFCLVLLESILCWRCRENGSTEVGKVSLRLLSPTSPFLQHECIRFEQQFRRCHISTCWLNHWEMEAKRWSAGSFDRLHEQLTESDDAAQCYMLYIQDIFSCGVSMLEYNNTYSHLTLLSHAFLHLWRFLFFFMTYNYIGTFWPSFNEPLIAY